MEQINHHNQKVAKNRGESWKRKLVQGRHEIALNPTKLRKTRIESGLSQELIAGNVGISTNTFGAIERGKRLVSQERAEKIAKEFGRKSAYTFFERIKGTLKYRAKKIR